MWEMRLVARRLSVLLGREVYPPPHFFYHRAVSNLVFKIFQRRIFVKRFANAVAEIFFGLFEFLNVAEHFLFYPKIFSAQHVKFILS